MVNPAFPQRFGIIWQYTSQEFIEHYSQRIDVRACVYVLIRHLRLLRTDVLWRSNELSLLGHQRPLRQWLTKSLGHPKVNNLWNSLLALNAYLYVRRLNIAVNYPFLVGMLDGLTYLHKQLETLLDGELLAVAVLGDGYTLDVFHHKIGSARVSRSGIINMGDVRMI